jgi:hypothetical protein
VRQAWIYGDDAARELADAWLDDLYDRDPEAWGTALIECLATPGYT